MIVKVILAIFTFLEIQHHGARQEKQGKVHGDFHAGLRPDPAKRRASLQGECRAQGKALPSALHPDGGRTQIGLEGGLGPTPEGTQNMESRRCPEGRRKIVVRLQRGQKPTETGQAMGAPLHRPRGLEGQLRQHFQAIFAKEDPTAVRAHHKAIWQRQEPEWQPFVKKDLEGVMVKWKNNKCTGLDRISMEAIRFLSLTALAVQ